MIGPLVTIHTNTGFVLLRPRSAESRLLHPSARSGLHGRGGIQYCWYCNAAIEQACPRFPMNMGGTNQPTTNNQQGVGI
jgi:hypothetical protein